MKNAWLAMAIVLLSGCATAPRLESIAGGSPVAFVFVKDNPVQGAAAVQDAAVSRGIDSGAKAGVVAGALSGLYCGPFLVLCVPISAMIGASAGSIAGATVGLTQKLPKETLAALSDRLSRLQQSVDPLVALRQATLARAGRHWTLTEDSSKQVVRLEVQRLYLTSLRRKQLALVLQVLVTLRRGESEGSSGETTQRQFEFVSPGSSLDVWLDGSSDLPETNLRSACEQIAAQVISELALR